MATGWEPSAGEYPVPPRNVQVVSPYIVGVLDIRWDDPAILGANSKFTVLGVNLYRAYNDRGPYQRINAYPVGGGIWRDFTDNALITNEIIHWDTSWLSRGDSVASRDPGVDHATIPTSPMEGHRGARWTFKTEFPLNKQYGQAVHADSPYDVGVTINGQVVLPYEVFGSENMVTLSNVAEFESIGEQNVGPYLPEGPEDEVLISYHTTKNLIQTNLDAKPVYRATTVAIDTNTHSGLIETPLNFASPISLRDVETMDWVWREAVSRNNWILQQGGERVKLFVRKISGQGCPCYQDPRRKEYYSQPRALCTICYGTGFVGGFDGPFEIIIAPDDADRRVSQTPIGRRLEHTYEVWTGPSPQLTHRDFIVKQTNERYAVGAIRNPAARGKPLQQHFNISYLDENNIVYKVPIDGTTGLQWPQTRGVAPILQGGAWPVPPNPPGPYPVGADAISPMGTEKENIPDERQDRGRSRVWENITYAVPFAFGLLDAVTSLLV